VADLQIKAANRLLLRADAFCMYDPTCPFHAEGKGSVVKVCVFASLPFIAIFILMISFLQAFSTVLDRALSGGYPNITADDIRTVVTVEFLSGNPDFAALNKVLALAVNGNATLLSYDALSFTQTYASLLPIACLDSREPFFSKNYSSEWFFTFRVRQILTIIALLGWTKLGDVLRRMTQLE
jgi:hypothetical protein